MNKNVILLKNLMLSTSQWNSYKYCKDKKKRGRIIGNTIGYSVLYIMLMAYSFANCIGLGIFGLADAIPTLCAVIISALALVFTFLKTNGYLFNFKEYDMLMSLPYEPKSIAACKFMYMYLNSLPWYLSVSFSMMIVYGIYGKPMILAYPVWIILTLFLPIIPMLAASFVGFLIAKIGSHFRNKTIAQTVVTILIILAAFGSRFFLEDMVRSNKAEDVMKEVYDTTGKMGRLYIPGKWFSDSILEMSISSMLLLIGVSAILFTIIFIVVGRSYRKINSALKSQSAARDFKMSQQKSKNVINAIAFKEFKRMTGSTTYMTNAGVGLIMCALAGVAILFIDVDELLMKMLVDAPIVITKEMIHPAIPLFIHFFVGMMATTAFTLSLEGKNFWIVKSLPISKKTLYHGKMIFDLYLTVPFMLFATITFSISMKVPFVNAVLYVIAGLVLCAFSSAWGMVCGIKHMKLDWENEVEIIKQGAAVTIYLLPNMFITMGLIVLAVYLGTMISATIITVILILIVAVLAALSYMRVNALSKE